MAETIAYSPAGEDVAQSYEETYDDFEDDFSHVPEHSDLERLFDTEHFQAQIRELLEKGVDFEPLDFVGEYTADLIAYKRLVVTNLLDYLDAQKQFDVPIRLAVIGDEDDFVIETEKPLHIHFHIEMDSVEDIQTYFFRGFFMTLLEHNIFPDFISMRVSKALPPVDLSQILSPPKDKEEARKIKEFLAESAAKQKKLVFSFTGVLENPDTPLKPEDISKLL